MVADDAHLPYLGQVSIPEVDADDELLIDSEDLVSCFNLFKLPESWAGFAFATFAKKAPATIFGGAPGEFDYVGMRVVPMGWINAVGLMQTVVRRLVFGLSKVPESSELSKLKWFPTDDSVSVVYLDSYDEVRRVKAEYKGLCWKGPRLQGTSGLWRPATVAPLNQGKRLIGAVNGTLKGETLTGRPERLVPRTTRKWGSLALQQPCLAKVRPLSLS